MDFFTHLEMHLRQENPPLSGRDHMSFRSAYYPVRDVVDGDLCEQYSQVRCRDIRRPSKGYLYGQSRRPKCGMAISTGVH